MNAGNTLLWLQQGIQHQQNGRLAEAEGLYLRILKREPNNHKAMFLLGLLRLARQNFSGAAELFDRAIAAAANVPDYHHGRARALGALGRFDQAAQALRWAIGLKPDHADAHRQLGNILVQLGRPAEGIELLGKAQLLDPRNTKIAFDVANALRRCGRLGEALTVATKAAQTDPGDAWGHNILGLVHLDHQHLEDAARHFRQAIALNPNLPEAHSNLAQVVEKGGQLTMAVDLLRTAVRIRPTYAGAYHNLGLALLNMGARQQAITALRQSLQLNDKAAHTHSALLYALNFQTDISREEVFAEHRRWADQHAGQFHRHAINYKNDRTPGRPLRIGYVSGNFHQHPVSYFLEPILRQHDRRQFTVICYANATRSDEVTERLRALAADWRMIRGLSDDEAAARIRQDGIDLLIDLSGHTERNRLLVLARKPAPVQITYLGYPNTTGMAAMDYRITDAVADPPGTADALNAEKLERLPKCFLCYCPPRGCPDPARLPGPITFGSFNRIEKINERVISAWSRILAEMPNARLLLKSYSLADRRLCEMLRQTFQRNGIGPKRVDLRASQTDQMPHLATYGEIDIALDTFPYNGTTTSCEALWMGVPVVTLAGEGHVSRVGLSLLTQLGLQEFAAGTEDEYVAVATKLARDNERLGWLRLNLRQQMIQSPLMDAAGFTRNLESAYRRMWEKWAAEFSAP